LKPLLANLPVSRRDRLFFSFSCLFRQQPKRDCLWQRASLDRLVNHLKSAMITLAKHLIVVTNFPNQQLSQNPKGPLNSDTPKA